MAKSFTDRFDKRWQLTIDVAACKRVKNALAINLYKLVEDGFRPLRDLLSDPIQLVDVIFVLSVPLDQQAASDEDFGRAMAGDALERAAEAFTQELVDFFPSRRQREALTKVLATHRQIKDRLMEKATADLAQIDPEKEADRALAEYAAKTSNGASGSGPDSVASLTPDPVRLAS